MHFPYNSDIYYKSFTYSLFDLYTRSSSFKTCNTSSYDNFENRVLLSLDFPYLLYYLIILCVNLNFYLFYNFY